MIKREYWTRTLSVWGLLLVGVLVVVIALLVPTYILLVHQVEALSFETVTAANSESRVAYEEAQKSLKKTQTLVQQLSQPHVGPNPSSVLDTIRNMQTDILLLSGFSYTDTANVEDPVQMQIHGIARTRAALVQFSAELNRNPLFTQVEIPVSDFAPDHDLSFTATVLLSSNAPSP